MRVNPSTLVRTVWSSTAGSSCRVLAADASHVEVDIHAVEPFDEPFERCGSRIVRDVDRFGLDLLRGESAQPFQLLRAASGRPDAPAGGDAAFGRFESNARGGAP